MGLDRVTPEFSRSVAEEHRHVLYLVEDKEKEDLARQSEALLAEALRPAEEADAEKEKAGTSTDPVVAQEKDSDKASEPSGDDDHPVA